MTLVEILVTVMVLGLGFLVVLGGITTAITASSQHRQQAEATTALVSYAEAVKKATYISCAPAATTYTPASVGYTVPAKYTAEVVSINYWHKATNTYDGTCVPASPDGDVQQITLRVSANNSLTAGVLKEDLTIIKRKP